MGTTRRAIAVTEQQDQWLKASDRAWEIYERQRIYQRSEPLQTSDVEGHQSGRNEAPRSKLRGITELKHMELPEVIAGLPLPLHIPLDCLPVRSLSYRRHIVPVGPKFSAPQHSFDGRLPSKDFPGCDALEHLHNPSRRHFRMGTAEEMDVILVRPNRFHLDRKSFRNLGRRVLDNRGHFLIQQRLAVFHRKHHMVVDLPRTVCPLANLSAPLIRHAPEGTRETDPRSRLRGITSWKHLELTESTRTVRVPEPFAHGSDQYSRSVGRHSLLYTPVAAISDTRLIS